MNAINRYLSALKSQTPPREFVSRMESIANDDKLDTAQKIEKICALESSAGRYNWWADIPAECRWVVSDLLAWAHVFSVEGDHSEVKPGFIKFCRTGDQSRLVFDCEHTPLDSLMFWLWLRGFDEIKPADVDSFNYQYARIVGMFAGIKNIAEVAA